MRIQPLLLVLAAFAAVAAAWAQTTNRASAISHRGPVASALPPAHDSFAAAQPVVGPSWSIADDNRAATREPNEPRIAGLSGGRSLWYRWEAPVSRRYHLSAWSSRSEIDTMVGVYVGGPTLGAVTEVASATGFRQRSASITDAALSFNAIAGTTYYIAVDSQTSATGSFVLSLIDSEWEFLGLGGGFVTPAVGPDGTLYTAESIGFLYAINPDGSQKWRFAMDGVTVLGGPALSPDGTVYIGDDSHTLYAIDAATGTARWRFQMTGEILSSPAIAADGTIYIRCENGKLYALTPGGTKKWEFALPASAVSLACPIVAGDGTIYCGAADGKLYAIDATGAKKWDFQTGAKIYGAPAIAADGTVYIGSSSRRFFALSPSGVQRWALDMPDEIGGSPAIGADGTIYFGCGDGYLYAVRPDGVILWDYATGAEIILGAPALAADGTIYIGSDDSLVHAVNHEGIRQRVFATGDYIAASPLLHRGALYIPSFDYRLYAIAVGQVPASSSWPMDRQNAARTGRLVSATLEIGVPPRSQTIPLGGTAAFTVGAVGNLPLTYQWFYNGTAIPGADAATLRVSPVTLQSIGQYSVSVADPTRSILSPAASLTVSGRVPDSDAHLASLATRAVVGTGADILIPGITVAGSTPKQLLIRAIGPALADFGVTGALARPQLRLLQGQTEIARNAGWDADGRGPALDIAFDQVGAFSLRGGSADCALLVTLNPGTYTAQISGLGNTTGVTLFEVYEFGATPSKLVSLSCRTLVGSGGESLISGLTVTGTGAKQFLIRAAGPALKTFGPVDALARPHLELFSGSTKLADNTGWSTAANAPQIADATRSAGSFAFAPGSADSALLVTLLPGSYTVLVSGVGATSGMSLLEIYEVP